MDIFIRSVAFASRLFGVFAAILIASSVVIVCQMVFIRYVLNSNTIWQTDFVTFSLIAATFLGAPYVLLTRGHVNVDVLPLMLGERGRFWLAMSAIVISFGFCATMTVLSFQLWHESWTENWVTETMWRARLWIPYASMPVGLALLSLQYVGDLLAIVTGREPPFGMDPTGRPA